jgi:hypothetical protein
VRGGRRAPLARRMQSGPSGTRSVRDQLYWDTRTMPEKPYDQTQIEVLKPTGPICARGTLLEVVALGGGGT